MILPGTLLRVESTWDQENQTKVVYAYDSDTFVCRLKKGDILMSLSSELSTYGATRTTTNVVLALCPNATQGFVETKYLKALT